MAADAGRTWTEPRRLRLAAAAIAIAFVGGLAGYAVRMLQTRSVPAPQSYEIRRGDAGLTNPLLECEVSGYLPGRELRPFREEIRRLAEQLAGRHAVNRIGLYFRDLDNGPWFGINEQQGFTGASLLKVPTIIALLLQAEESPGLLARTVRFEGYEGAETQGQFLPQETLVLGKSYTVDDLLQRAAALSDNAAIGVLNKLARPEVLERVFNDLGVPHPPAGDPAAKSLTPVGYGHLFRVLYNASYLSRPLSERALGYFARSNFHGGLEAGVPPGTVVAHKFGIYSFPDRPQPAQLHDCGIIYFPGRPYFLCVMTEGQRVDELAAAIQEISLAVYRAVNAQTPPPPR